MLAPETDLCLLNKNCFKSTFLLKVPFLQNLEMNKTYRKISTFIELERSIKYLRLGLAELQKITPANDFYDPVFLYLSGGLERLFKSMLCLNFLDVNNRLPNPSEIWNNQNGHDLMTLKSKVEEICIPVTRPFASMDYEIIVSNSFINHICKILTEFGRRSRYFNLDAILGIDQEFDSKSVWEKMEVSINIEIYGRANFYQMLADPQLMDSIFQSSNTEILIRLERFFRALTRQFIFGNFSSESKTYIFQIEDFSGIDDNQLGTTDYGKFDINKRINRKSK